MSDELDVDVVRLREVSRFVADRAREMRDEVARLDATIGRELLADGWQGRAASAYDESWVEWKDGANTVVAALERSSASLAEAAIQYELQDEATRSRIDGLPGLDLP
ncbi:WXG100 family type VII secretion target [Nocardia puris]|uniref:ESAT-6-like protein n=1 Tax=Nocardia puris TaxID=208602 RepID=A0A366CSE5_9NOCA|nr:WXG100 family type VII secretion target [Nocardia puris]RBO78289.1 WXG100 family type VII secretion target [Nocardia puris]